MNSSITPKTSILKRSLTICLVVTTLVGSCLRSNFKSVAAQGEVFTMEFKQDIGIKAVEDSVIYALNFTLGNKPA